MVRRAFRGAFCEDELDDIYATAWVGTLRALETRHAQLTDDEVRSYLFTAVAHQAGRELRRRRRKPTQPLELDDATPDLGIGPEEAAARAERSRVARDLLSSLPPRRRAVMLLRYGWGLDPDQVCRMVDGLSPRAYRKEVTRGVDELSERVRAFERGEWCAERAGVLKTYVAGVADDEGTRQAKAHLSHCRQCSEFVARLTGHLHDLGGALVAPAAIAGIDGHASAADRALGAWTRVKEAVGNGTENAEQAAGSILAGGGTRGAGAGTGAGIGGILGIGGTAKVVAGCFAGAAATAACVTTLVPGPGLTHLANTQPAQKAVADPRPTPQRQARATNATLAPVLPNQVGNEVDQTAPAPATPPPTDEGAEQASAGQDPAAEPAASASAEPVQAQEAAQSDFSFESDPAAPAPAPAPAPAAPAPTSTPAGGEGGGGGGAPSGDFAFGGG